MTVLPKVRQVILAAMEASLDELVKDQVLEERAFQVMQIDLTLVSDAEQRAGHTGIIKIEFGRFSQPLVEIPVVGW